MRRILCFSGIGSGAGKTTAASTLADQTFSIAGALRGELSRQFPRYDWFRTDQDYKETTIVHEMAGKPTVREAMTLYGQAVCKEDPQHWVKKLIEHLKEVDRIADGVTTIAVDDVRKMCELDALKECFPGRVVHLHVIGSGAKEEKHFDNDELMAVADYLLEY